MSEGYAGYTLNYTSKKELLQKFPPKFPKVIAHHITTAFGVTADAIPEPATARVVGYAMEDGLEALVVEIGGTTKRKDGSVYHITWSLDPRTHKPVDSNKLLKNGWTKVDPSWVVIQPKFFPFETKPTEKD